MYSFTCDYSEGAHPNVLKKLQELNYVQHPGYGEDTVTDEAIERIRQSIGNPKASIYFVIGGTQANMAVISALLRTPEAVICVEGGHIFAHETGAIEATGHRVITVPGIQGKLTPAGIQKALDDYFMRPHMVKPQKLAPFIKKRSCKPSAISVVLTSCCCISTAHVWEVL